MNQSTLPMAILGGSDREPGHLPPTGSGEQLLAGVKALDVKIAGRSLIELLIERYRSTGSFDPIYVAGPKSAYQDANIDAEIIDTDAGFGGNIQVAIEAVLERHPSGVMAMSTSDILPDLSELDSLLEDYRSGCPCDLWFPLIRAPEDPERLGASSWKPRYMVTTTSGVKTPVLPSHLAIVKPRLMRRRFIYKVLEGAYKTRNRPVLYRRSYLARQLIGGLLAHDLRRLFTLRFPHVTWDVVRHGYAAARRLRDGVTTQVELEDALRGMFAKRAHRLEHPERRTRLPVLDGMSLARDIDTVEEARALEAQAAAAGSS